MRSSQSKQTDKFWRRVSRVWELNHWKNMEMNLRKVLQLTMTLMVKCGPSKHPK